MKSFSQLLKDNNVVDPNGNFNTPYEMVNNMRDSGTDTSGVGLINKIKSKVSEKGINMKKGGNVNMKKIKRFAGGGSGSIVPRDLAEEDSSLDVNYDKVPGLGAATGRARENTVIPKSAGIAERPMPSKPTPPRSRSDLSAVTGLDKKLSTRVGRERAMKSGGSVGSASKRADGIAQRGKTKGKVC
jgi:hypothetical protein